MSFESFMSSIEEISTMPELIRNEERECYEYPEEFHYKFFKLNDVILYVRQKTNIHLSIKLLEFIYNMIMSEIPSSIESESSSQTESTLNVINQLREQYAEVISLIQTITAQVDSISQNIPSIETEPTSEPIPSIDIKKEILNAIVDETILSKITTEVGSVVWNAINPKLNDVVKSIVDQMMSTKMMPVTSTNILNSPEPQPNIYKILVLKQSGFTGDEILKLADKGLL